MVASLPSHLNLYLRLPHMSLISLSLSIACAPSLVTLDMSAFSTALTAVIGVTASWRRREPAVTSMSYAPAIPLRLKREGVAGERKEVVGVVGIWTFACCFHFSLSLPPLTSPS